MGPKMHEIKMLAQVAFDKTIITDGMHFILWNFNITRKTSHCVSDLVFNT
jgi:hypothetical protein